MSIDPIATVRSCFGEKFAIPRQPGLCPSAWGKVIFHPPYRSREAVRGIEGFSRLWLIFGFHATAGQGWKPTVRPPRLGGNQRVGVFASRSTFRPNGLGLSLVKLEGVDHEDPDGPVLLLGGIDLLDGTPVYDVKPYLPYAEAQPEASGGFATGEIQRLPVEIAPEAEPAFALLPTRSRAVLMEALSLDPRPATRADESGREFGALLCGCNVVFFIRDGVCRICSIEKAEGSGLNA
ncbi:MAG: tRNA (N6-threonylcarbamoyladenosine(37)-N6)-methyltransferase TrmO [Verrucomicrobiaceae bacterium]|nr:MAG: tRNA (N6-threonylcarbamoyladenosine(37)-N6)-methyltransferase TrmO [Verrucomicrobiaceae bacterium]